MNVKTTPYTISNLKKMNTVRLTATFTRIMGYTPSQFVDRNMMVQMVWSKQHPVAVSGFSVERAATTFVARQIAEQDRTFSDSQVREMRGRWNAGQGDSINGLAKEFGCTFMTMNKIVRRESYKEIY